MNDLTSSNEESGNGIKASKPIYLPGLNGLRAIAALAVVFFHITLELKHFGLDNAIFGTDIVGNATNLLLGGFGVTIFFTLSGFLITYLLLKEKELTGGVKIKAFYIRRALRIWPLYYLYFFISMATIFIYAMPFEGESIPFYIFLAANIPFIIGKAIPFLMHYWSIGVEEQFYLFFPHIAKQSNKKLLNIVIALIGIFMITKFVFWVLYTKYSMPLPFMALTVTRFHAMLIGVVGAILYYNQNKIFLTVATHKITQLLAWTSIFLITLNKFYIFSAVNDEVVSVVALILIMGQITKRNYLINLENKVCDFVGKISYGMYIIHPLLIFFMAKLLGNLEDTITNYILVYTLVIAATMLLAYVSYEYYEKWFLKLKKKYESIQTTHSKTTQKGHTAVVPVITLPNRERTHVNTSVNS